MSDKYCTLLFLIKDDSVLLAMKKRGFGANRYNGVGGKIEPGETIEEALVRESQEEIEVIPTKFKKVAEHDFLMDRDTKKPWHMYVHAFVATEWQGEPTETEEMAPQWFKRTEIPYDNMWQDDTYWLPQVLAGQLILASYEFNADETMASHNIMVVDKMPQGVPWHA